MPTTAEEVAFLKPIRAAFADDGPRLIYADYLGESNQPTDIARSEFIRLQIAIARLDDDHAQKRSLLRRQNELLIRFHAEWTKPLRELVSGCEFRRGILDTVSVDARVFCDRGNRLFRDTAIRRVKFLDAGAKMDKLAQCPALAQVRELDLCGNDLGNGGLNLLLRSPYLQQLESLDLSFNGIGNGGAEMLANARSLAKLRALHLNDNRTIGCDGIRSLARSPFFGQLRTLDVSGNDVADAGLVSLIESPTLSRLNRLRLHANRIGDVGVAALAQSDLLGRMLKRSGRLDLRENDIGPIGATALAASLAMASARALDLGGNQLRDDGVIALAESEFLGRLRKLNLGHNRVGDPGAARLAFSALMTRLDALDVSSNRITPRAVELLWAKRKNFNTALESSGQFGFSTIRGSG